MAAPLISVVTAVYNGALHVEETVRSILQQTISDFEYIIIDDASTDDSVDRIMGFADPRIKILRNTVNSRLVKTRNRGLELATGRYIALIDHDDVADATRLEAQSGFLEDNPEFILVGSQAANIDESGKYIKSRIVRNDSPEQLKARLLFRNSFVNSTLFFRRNSTMPMTYRTEFPLSEDYDFIVRIAEFGKIYILPKKLVNYRLHANNFSGVVSQQMFHLGVEIKRAQLGKMNVQYSEHELQRHSCIEHLSMTLDTSTLNAVSAWMVMLIGANNKKNIYQKHAFNSVVYDELSCIGEHAAKSGNVNLSDYLTSEYLSALKSNPMVALRILAKMALRIRGTRR